MQSSKVDSGLALVIEIVGGLLGFLGIGYLYAGLTTEGLIRLIGWWVIIVMFTILAVISGGLFALCLGPFILLTPIVFRDCAQESAGWEVYGA